MTPLALIFGILRGDVGPVGTMETCSGRDEPTAAGDQACAEIISTLHPSPPPQDAGKLKPQSFFSSAAIKEGWDQPLLFAFPISASEMCTNAYCVSWPLTTYLSSSRPLPSL